MKHKGKLSALFDDINWFFKDYQVGRNFNLSIKGCVEVYDCKMTSDLAGNSCYKYWTKEIKNAPGSNIQWVHNVRQKKLIFMILGMEYMNPDIKKDALYQGWKPYSSIQDASMERCKLDFKDTIIFSDSLEKRWAEISQVELWATIEKSVQEVMGEADYDIFMYKHEDGDPKPYPHMLFGASFYFFYCQQKQLLICMQFATCVNPPADAPTSDDDEDVDEDEEDVDEADEEDVDEADEEQLDRHGDDYAEFREGTPPTDEDGADEGDGSDEEDN